MREADAFVRDAAGVLGTRAVELDEVDHACGLAPAGEAAEGGGWLPDGDHQRGPGGEQAARLLDGVLGVLRSVVADEQRAVCWDQASSCLHRHASGRRDHGHKLSIR